MNNAIPKQLNDTTAIATQKISCVVPAYNEAANLSHFIPQLSQVLLETGMRAEIIVVDDGSRDESIAVLKTLLADYPLTVLQLSRNFGKEVALTAGIEAVRDSDCVILMDADFQHPFSLIPSMLELWRGGYEMIYGIRDRQLETAFKRKLSFWFYRLLNATSSVPMPMDAGDFRLMDKKVVTVLQNLPERTRYMKGLYAWVGFKTIGVHFQVQQREHGVSSFNFWSLFKLAITGFTAFSDLPLRLSIWAGVVVSLLSFGYGAYVMFSTLITGGDVPGWATLVVALTFLGGVQLLFIGILGEYISRIYSEVKARPKYIVSEIMRHPSSPVRHSDD